MQRTHSLEPQQNHGAPLRSEPVRTADVNSQTYLAPVAGLTTVANVSSEIDFKATIVSESPKASAAAAQLPVIQSGANRYQPVQKLGEGGMGEVLLSRDSAIGRKVAVKRMKHRVDEEMAAQFLAEVQTTGQLEHPGIVPVYDVGHDAEGNPYYVMKHIDGEPLDRIIAKLNTGDPEYLRRFSYEHRTEIFMQLLRAVQYAHKQGILHLDIKPANVIVGPFGEVVLVDWGIARSVAPDKNDGSPDAPKRNIPRALSGTPAYMSPEQALGDASRIDQRTDTYCLSVLFYEFITLHYYLTPKTTMQGCLTSILIDEPLTALQMHHRFGAPPELTNYIRFGLNKEIDQRFQTVDEMVDKLQQVINGQIPIVCPCTGIKRTANLYGDFMNAHPILAVAGVALVSLFSIFGVFEMVRLIAVHV